MASTPALGLLAAVLLSCMAAHAMAAHQQQDTFTVQYAPGMRDQVIEDAARKGWNVLREYKRFNRLIVSPTNDLAVATATSAATAAAAAAAAAAADPAGAATSLASIQMAALQSLQNVAGVERNGWVQAPRPVPDYEAVSSAPSSSFSSLFSSQGLAPAAVPAAAAGPDVEPVCGLGDPSNPDAGLGIESEGVPYGITLTQSDHPEMQAIAKEKKGNILWCVIDTGLDITNQEFDKEKTSGCIGPGPAGNITTRDSFKYCYNWYEDQSGHGTHTSGTVAALRNGRGVVGVAPEGAHLYHYNFFGPHSQEPVDLTVATWLECIDELDRRKAATSNPDMKLVISMSFGVDYPNGFAAAAIKSLAAERADVLWLASAGNSGDNTMGYPAGYPEIMSVGAVDWNGVVAGFSTRNSAVDIAAPGVKTVSTIPLAKTADSEYYFSSYKHVVITEPPIPDVATTPDFFSRPPVGRVSGSPGGSVSAPLVDCSIANGTCEGAAGKICLIQRGSTTFCSKAAACTAAGGVGAIIYNGEDRPDCERLTGVDISTCAKRPEGQAGAERPEDQAGWPLILVTLSKQQGEALRAALAEGVSLSVALNVPSVPAQKEIGLAALSGTSMACPTAAGVAGLVWSAHTDCNSAEIRQALEKAAKRPAGSDADVEWDEEYGHGIIQAWDAHQYLLANPCSSAPRAVDVTVSHSLSQAAAAEGSEDEPRSGGQATTAYVDVKIAVKEAVAGAPVAGQAVRLAVRPVRLGSKGAITCQSYKVMTDALGVASTRCRLSPEASGTAVITARVPASSGYQAATKVYVIRLD